MSLNNFYNFSTFEVLLKTYNENKFAEKIYAPFLHTM